MEKGVANLEIGVKQLGGEVADVKTDVKGWKQRCCQFDELSKQMEKLVESHKANDNVPGTPMSNRNVNGNPNPTPQSSNVFNLSVFFRTFNISGPVYKSILLTQVD